MMWHILRKDFRLLWPLVGLVAALQLATTWAKIALGPFGEPAQLGLIANVLTGAVFVGAAMLIISVVHLDPVPGVNQDWLVRPIRRGDLILAKLVFIVVTLHGPMLAADLVRGILAGVPWEHTAGITAARSAVVFMTFDLPVAALATVTSTAIETVGAMLVLWLAILTGLVAGSAVRGGAPPFAGTGLQWMVPSYWALLALVAALVVIPLQYLRRTTAQSRRIVIGAALLAPALSLASWPAAFAFQQRFSRDPVAAARIGIAFDPALGSSRTPGGSRGKGTILLPVRVTGLLPETIVRNDRAMIRIVGADGAILFAGPSVGFASEIDDFPVRTAKGGAVRLHQVILLPAKVAELIQDHPVRLEIDYSLTLLGLTAATSAPAVGGDVRLSGFGPCRTRSDDEGDDVVVGCIKPGHAPDCVAGTLEDRASGRRNPEDYLCRPDYAPFSAPYLDVVHQFEVSWNFAIRRDSRPIPLGRAR